MGFRIRTCPMSTSFLDLLDNIWNSLDDILVCVGVFLIAQIASSVLHRSMRTYFRLGAYISQASQFLLLFSVFIFLTGHLLGSETAVALFSGFSIGFGYALQPYIVSLMAGGTFYISGTVRRGDTLHVGEQSVHVESVGLLFVTTKQDKLVTYFPNSVLSSRPFSVERPSL